MSIVAPTFFKAGCIPGLFGMQKRNMEALSAAQRQLIEGLGMLAKQQNQSMQTMLRQVLGAAQAAPQLGDVRGLIGTRIDDLKSSILEAQARSNAASEIMMRSLGEAAGTLQTRMLAALDEFKALVVADGPSPMQPSTASPTVRIKRSTAI